MAETKKIRIQYFRSKNNTPFKHKLVVKGLGFTRLNQIVERVDTESTRGMVHHSAPGKDSGELVFQNKRGCRLPLPYTYRIVSVSWGRV